MFDDTVPDHGQYLDAAAATDQGRAYKRRFLAALDVRPGMTVVDLGCGPGTDLAALAEAVGERGTVIGVDNDPVMVERASRRCPTVEVRLGDAHALPVRDGSADRARADRVLQHLENPRRALSELRRALRTGGVLGLAEPDWDTLVIDAADETAAARLAGYIGTRVRNRTIGRQLARLSSDAGLEVSTVDAIAIVFRDLDTAELVLGLRRNMVRATRAGVTLPEDLLEGQLLASFVVWTVTAKRPAADQPRS
jgi:SAM-dependent methyltransferase